MEKSNIITLLIITSIFIFPLFIIKAKINFMLILYAVLSIGLIAGTFILTRITFDIWKRKKEDYLWAFIAVSLITCMSSLAFWFLAINIFNLL
jgi:hypothetical protein